MVQHDARGPQSLRAQGGWRHIRIGQGTDVRGRFTAFWNQIPIAFDRPRIPALDFAALMCIVLNETGGDFSAHPEVCGRGRPGHPGLAYAFDRIPDLKASYNTLSGNRRAGDLFDDADFITAHGSLGGAQRLARHGLDFGGAWGSDAYPQDQFSTAEDLSTNGFIMQADFYKFRGRGVIQTTSRGAYLGAVRYIQSYGGGNTVLADFRRRWSGLDPGVAATVSSNADWDRIFAQTEMLARGVALHAGSGVSDYRAMSSRADVLLNVPDITQKGVQKGMQGSIYFMGRRISGSERYGAGLYRARVVALGRGMLALTWPSAGGLMQLTTTPTIEGKRITRYCGVIAGEAILGANLFKDLFAGIRDLVGGRSATYERELQRARDLALQELEQRAHDLGANAVVGIDLDYEVLGQGNGMLMVSASGTAVVVE